MPAPPIDDEQGSAAAQDGPSSSPQTGDRGMLDDVMRRSAGIPGNDPVGKTTKPTSNPELRLIGLGFELVGVVVIFGFIGHAIDVYMHWNVAATITLVIIAFVGDMYLLIKAGMKGNK